MPTIEEIQARCAEFEQATREDGRPTCRAYGAGGLCVVRADHACIVFPPATTGRVEVSVSAAEHTAHTTDTDPHAPSPIDTVKADLAKIDPVTGLPILDDEPVSAPPSPTEVTVDLGGVGFGQADTQPAPGERTASARGGRLVGNQVADVVRAMRWSWSRVSAWRRCPFKWYLHYIEQLVPEFEPDWAIEGKAYHSAIESVYMSKGERLVIESSSNALVDAKIEGVISGLLRAGLLYYPGPWEIEKKIDFTVIGPSGAPIDWTSRLDLVSEDGTEIRDHKSMGSDPAESTLLDVLYQMSVYRMAEPRAETIRIHAIRKPALKLTKGESLEQFRDRISADVAKRPDFYYFVPTYYTSECDFAGYFAELCHEVEMIRESASRGCFPRHRNSCQFGAKCEFFGLCLQRL